jgi:hypothetical protein
VILLEYNKNSFVIPWSTSDHAPISLVVAGHFMDERKWRSRRKPLTFLNSKNKGLSSKSKKAYSMGKRKGTIGQTMIYKNKLHKLRRKLKTEKQELKIGGELGCILFGHLTDTHVKNDSSWFSWHTIYVKLAYITSVGCH